MINWNFFKKNILIALLLFPASSFAAFDVTNINTLSEFYKRYNGDTLTGGHAIFDNEAFYTLKNKDTVLRIPYSDLSLMPTSSPGSLDYFFVNGKIYNNLEEVKTAYSIANPGKTLSDDNIIIITDANWNLSKNISSNKNLESLNKSDTNGLKSFMASVSSIFGILDNRISSINGISAGDFLEETGVWFKGNYNNGSQKSYDQYKGYNIDQYSGTFGVDTGDEIKIGLSYSYLANEIKEKQLESKENIKSNIGTIYSSAELNPEISVNGQISYGFNNIKKSRNSGVLSSQIATAKVKGNMTFGKLSTNYHYKPENYDFSIIPNLGISHFAVSTKGYEEKGDGINRKVEKMSAHRTSALLGIQVNQSFEMEPYNVMLGIYTNLDYAVNSKISDTKSKITNITTNFNVKSGKINHPRYNLGIFAKIVKSDFIQLGLEYDLALSRKYKMHSRSINIRVDF